MLVVNGMVDDIILFRKAKELTSIISQSEDSHCFVGGYIIIFSYIITGVWMKFL